MAVHAGPVAERHLTTTDASAASAMSAAQRDGATAPRI
jgi:hypothetical protein